MTAKGEHPHWNTFATTTQICVPHAAGWIIPMKGAELTPPCLCSLSPKQGMIDKGPWEPLHRILGDKTPLASCDPAEPLQEELRPALEARESCAAVCSLSYISKPSNKYQPHEAPSVPNDVTYVGYLW